MMKFRVGIGYDVHRLEEGHALYLGGVNIAHSKGAVGHSDADVIIHAICDALLGAAGLKDIGYYFPDTDPAYKGIDSKKLLAKVVSLLKEKQYYIGNADISLCLEKPKIKPHIDAMREALSPIMNISAEDISIKATTNEQMGFVGREEGVAAYAVAMIYKK